MAAPNCRGAPIPLTFHPWAVRLASLSMKLYSTPRTRSARCRWVLQELGVHFEAIPVRLSQGDTRFLKLNPYGRVPVLVDGDLVLSASVAICL
ncbi:glutathione S-transferase N-terminal domain-containing protein [Methyloterricola oryzae]|uniref:glutathione S-transferase N-terminal domain-containing protein n=1 Tax=Methyloterricola oryzae TaxID=1495050 RepID=UPI0009E230FF